MSGDADSSGAQTSASAPASASASSGNSWTQLSGHAGSFRPGSRPGRVMKRLCQAEADCLLAISSKFPGLAEFAPAYYGTVRQPEDGPDYLEMQDLLAGFAAPAALMDCKVGCRTYLEDEVASARLDAKPRPDMFRRMAEADPEAATPEQRAAGAVTKLDYMLWRERLSSTSTLAFRIDGLRCGDGGANGEVPCDDTRLLRRREDVLTVLRHFVASFGSGSVAGAYLARLRQLRQALVESEFFPRYELIGSSLLFVHDRTGRASVWMIDFGKTRPSPFPLSHCTAWTEGNHEDGYLTGLDNIIGLLDQLVQQEASP